MKETFTKSPSVLSPYHKKQGQPCPRKSTPGYTSFSSKTTRHNSAKRKKCVFRDSAHVTRRKLTIRMKSRPSVCLSVTPLTRLNFRPAWTYQLSNIINPSSSYFKFVTASKCGDQIASIFSISIFIKESLPVCLSLCLSRR